MAQPPTPPQPPQPAPPPTPPQPPPPGPQQHPLCLQLTMSGVACRCCGSWASCVPSSRIGTATEEEDRNNSHRRGSSAWTTSSPYCRGRAWTTTSFGSSSGCQCRELLQTMQPKPVQSHRGRGGSQQRQHLHLQLQVMARLQVLPRHRRRGGGRKQLQLQRLQLQVMAGLQQQQTMIGLPLHPGSCP